MNIDQKVERWLVSNGVVPPGLDGSKRSFRRLGERLLADGLGVPSSWWDGSPLEQNYLTLHLLTLKLRRTDLSRRGRKEGQAKAHELRNLIARLGGLPSRGFRA
jgi:hypothetical protein